MTINMQDKINLLFEVFRKPNGKRYRNVEVAAKVNITDAALSNLRIKNLQNPTFKSLQAIAAFFDVPIDYFACQSLEEARLYLASIQAGLMPPQQVEQYRDNQLLSLIMEKAMTMSNDAQRDILRMMEWFEYGDRIRQ